MFSISLYNDSQKSIWDDFVKTARNEHFMFLRDYMEYHKSRFQDHSLMIYQDSKLIALLPAHTQDSNLVSHGGLSFAGLIINKSMKLYKMLELFEVLIQFLKDHDFQELIYKAIPSIYHKQPATEDLYALTKYQAILIKRDASSVIDLRSALGFEKGRKGCIKKAQKENLRIKVDDSYETFFEMMAEHLDNKYSAKAVHSLEEINYLKSLFPENIKLYTAHKEQKLIAGILIYINHRTVKTQYISSNDLGREFGAIDLIVHQLITEDFKSYDFFDFGTSVNASEYGFNQSLMAQKEMFGARTLTHDTYRIKLQ